MESQAEIEAQGDIFKFRTLETDDEKTLFIIGKMKEFDKRFQNQDEKAQYNMDYFKALSKEVQRLNG